ncbi:hypothetical protein ANRL4_03780 [Anaerolineae bacterium]|nr:hypothetical protein ANRL4_03780 [Anaerolineae bacterium]
MSASPLVSQNEALAHYNRQFNPQTWKAARGWVAHEVRQSEHFRDASETQCEDEIARLMNLITDAALELSGHGFHQGACLTLIRVMDTTLSEPTRQAIFAHLETFVLLGDSRLRDYRLLSAALEALSQARRSLLRAVSLTSGLRDWRGNAIYFSIHAAFMETSLAGRLIAEDSPDYVASQQRIALNDLRESLHALVHINEEHSAYFTVLAERLKE